MTLTPYLTGLFVFAAICAVLALAQATRARRHWRARRRFSAGYRLLWGTVFALLGLLGALCGAALIGWHRLVAEAPVAQIQTRQIAAQQFAVTVVTPDGTRREATVAGDEWQLDARVIKWDPRALVLGAPPLYRLERLNGRYRDVARENESAPSVLALSDSSTLDLWNLKQRFPAWLSWIDADYGSAAYLPLVDDGDFSVTLAAAGGLVARPADAATAQKLKAAGW
jgi:hypothetical protein